MKRLASTDRALAALVALALATNGAVAGAACLPAVELTGEAVLVDAIRLALQGRGVGGVRDGCPAVRAQVAHNGEQLLLRIRDTGGRESERAVASAEVAASVIESWARPELSSLLLTPVTAEPTLAPTASATPTVARVAEPSSRRGNGLMLGAESSVADDRSLWLGVRGAACFRTGPACSGAIARFALDAGSAGRAAALDARRLAAEVLVASELPLRSGRLTVYPGVAAGLGWIRTQRSPPEMNGEGEVDSDQETATSDAGGLRLEGHLHVSLRLTSRAAIDLGVAIGLSPLAQTQDHEQAGLVLPGEPVGYLRAGLALRYGLP